MRHSFEEHMPGDNAQPGPYKPKPAVQDGGSAAGAAGVAREVIRENDDEALRRSQAQLEAETAALSRLNEVCSRLWRMQTLRDGLDEMLAATIDLLGADFGIIQLFDPQRNVLVIAAHRGFKPEFLAYFREVSIEDESACGRALRSSERVIVEDVETDAPYRTMRGVAREAGYRAVQTTPLLGRDGKPLGMLSTHFRSPHRPTEQDLRRLDLYIRQAVDFIERIRIEELLREREERLRLALQAGSLGAWDWDIPSNRVTWSPTLERIHGLEPGSFEGTFAAFQNDIHPEDRQRIMASLERTLNENEEHHIEYRIVRLDGSTRWVEAHGALVRDDLGAPIQMIGVCTDITERKWTDETIRSLLRISERLNSTLDTNTLLDILVQEAIALVGAESGLAGLHTPEGMESRRYFQRGTVLALNYRWPSMHGLPGWLIANKVPYLTNDAMGDQQIVRELCVQFGVRSALSTPILSNDRRVLGFFEIHNKEGGFNESDKRRLLAVSHAASIAIQNAIAYRRIEQAEHSARESEERFARFMQHLPGLAWIKDLQGRYVYANDAAERAFRTPREQLYGRTDEQIFAPATAAVFRENDRCAIASESGIQTLETLEHDDGVHHSLVHKFPIPGSDGRLGWVGGMAIDVTERIRAEEALRESEQRYRAVVESQAELVCRFRPDGEIVFVNGAYARARGTTPEALLGRNFWDFVPKEDRPAVRAMLDALSPAMPEVRIENRFVTADGERWMLWTNTALAFDSAGRFREAQSTGIDITDRKRAEEALRAANQDLEQFAYSASHDLQEPLRNIAVFSQLLERSYHEKLDSQGEQFLANIVGGAKRMSSLLSDLLAYSQISSCAEEAVERTNSESVLAQVLTDFANQIAESGAAISRDALPFVFVRPGHLRQLFQNLIGNAIKYRKESEELRVHLQSERDGSMWRFSVTDNGIGIRPEFQRQIFGLFKRLHANTEKYAGTGVGLAICQRIVAQYGGRIWVESEEGVGSVFTFTLPGPQGV